MSLLQHGRSIYNEHGVWELLRRSYDFVRERGAGWIGAHLLAESSIGSKFKYAISHSAFLTTVYFYIRRTFKHEKRAILRGHYQYYKKEREREDPEHRIIRHTHMLEKGISMENRREVFGVAVANELVENVIAAWKRRDEPESDDQLRWSIDVLAKYFEVVSIESEALQNTYNKFQKFVTSTGVEIGNRVPRPRHSLETNPVEFDNLRALAEQRSSTRWFQDKPVSHDVIDKAIRVAAESPSACNRQSFEYRIYDDKELLDEILQPPLGVTGYRDNIPCVVVLVGKHRGYFRESEKNVPLIDGSLSAMTFQYALESLGLASCTINWPAMYREHNRMERLLNLDEDENIILLMAVGHPNPEGKVPYSNKKNIENLRSYNKCD